MTDSSKLDVIVQVQVTPNGQTLQARHWLHLRLYLYDRRWRMLNDFVGQR
jgi:hypothetical protein